MMQPRTCEPASRVLGALAIAGLLGAAAPAAAQQDPSAGAVRYGASNPPPFNVADANRNGVLEPREVHAFGIPFNRLDTSNDGYVTREEYLTGTARYAVPDDDGLDPNRQVSDQ